MASKPKNPKGPDETKPETPAPVAQAVHTKSNHYETVMDIVAALEVPASEGCIQSMNARHYLMQALFPLKQLE